MDIPSPTRPYRIGFLLFDGFALMSYAAAREPLRAANLLAGRTLYSVQDVPATGGRARSSSGAIVPGGTLVGESFDFDLVLLVAGGDPFAIDAGRVAPWLRGLARRGTRLGGVSGGPVILARAGLMAGRRMTLHWEHVRPLEEIQPDIALERSLFVMDRDRLTCAGGTAPLDMMHALVAEQHGPHFATRVSDWLIHTDIRRSAGPQRPSTAERHGINHPRLLAVVEAMEAGLSRTRTLDEWASHAGVGKRQLDRLFREHLGTSPLSFHRSLRLEKASALLSRTGLSVSEIALATGFTSFSGFSTAFARRFEQSPRAHRKERRPANGLQTT